MNNIWFSSDWHLGHKNIAGPKCSNWDSGYRDFENVQKMNEEILLNINNYVEENDIIYYLGDFSFGGHINTPKYRDKIICRNIYFINGNHDKAINLYKDCFKSIQDVAHISINNQEFFLSHYSHRVWYGSHKGVIHLYGHSHDSLDKDGDYWGKSMDVGIDSAKRILGEYRPFKLEEVVEIMNKRDVYLPDHHNINTNK